VSILNNRHRFRDALLADKVEMFRVSKAFFNRLNPNSSRDFWKTIKNLSKKQSSVPALNNGEYTAITDKEKAELLNNHFSRSFNYSLPPLEPDSCITDTFSDFPEELLCTEEEVSELLLSIDTAKASGPDRLSGRMLKSTATSIAPAITRLFNLSLRTGRLPVEWKVAQVIPIPKSSDASDPANYRPVSLLSVLSKLLEKHIRAHLLDHLVQVMSSSGVLPRGSQLLVLC